MEDCDGDEDVEGYLVEEEEETRVVEPWMYDVVDPREVDWEIDRMVSRVADVVCMPKDDVQAMLHCYRWDCVKFQEEWFARPCDVRQNMGILLKEDAERAECSGQAFRCLVCLEYFPRGLGLSCGCGHSFCRECWKGYVVGEIGSGMQSLDMRCPMYKCEVRVPQHILEILCDAKEVERLKKYQRDDFVDKSSCLTWCPGKDCTMAVRFSGGASLDDGIDVTCQCGAQFCFLCKEEAHRPVSCNIVRMWLLKNSAESGNMTWILANTKPCPKCGTPIEKNKGCMHIVCSKCRNEFCWLCLGQWNKHGERTGGFYSCNMYKKKIEIGEGNEQEGRHRAKLSIERYLHYWERWAEHDKALKITQKLMDEWESDIIKELADMMEVQAAQLKFVTDAWQEILKCRRILKWTYAAGYFAFDENTSIDSNVFLSKESKVDARKLQALQGYFDFSQNDAEISLERISHKVERDLPNLIVREKDFILEFNHFQEDLIGLTDVTRAQFQKLVEFLTNGLDKSIDQLREATFLPRTGLLSEQEASMLLHATTLKPSVPNKVNNETEHIICARCGFSNEVRRKVCDMCDSRLPQ